MSIYNSYQSFDKLLEKITKCNDPDRFIYLNDHIRNYLLGQKYEPYKEILKQYENAVFMQQTGRIDCQDEIDQFQNENIWLIPPEDADEYWKPEPDEQIISDEEITQFKIDNWFELRRAAYDNPEFIRLLKEASCDYIVRNNTTKKLLFEEWETKIKTFFPKPT